MRSAFLDIGIVIRSIDSGEADKFITILTENHGLCNFIGRGARRMNSKKAPHLDMLNLVKFQTNKGENTNYLDQAETISFYPKIKTDLTKVSLCMTFCEIIFNTIPLEVEDREVFLSLKIFLDSIENSTDKKEANRLSRQFGLYLLRHLGYPPPKSPNTDNLTAYFETIMSKKIVSGEIRV